MAEKNVAFSFIFQTFKLAFSSTWWLGCYLLYGHMVCQQTQHDELSKENRKAHLDAFVALLVPGLCSYIPGPQRGMESACNGGKRREETGAALEDGGLAPWARPGLHFILRACRPAGLHFILRASRPAGLHFILRASRPADR